MKLLFVSALLGAFLAQGEGDLSSGASAKEEIKLVCKTPPTKKRPSLTLEGTASFSDGTVLNVMVDRLDERNVSGRLVPSLSGRPAAAMREVKDKKIAPFDFAAEGPGLYRAAVELQGKESTPRKWEFDFLLWDEGLVSPLSDRLREVDGRVEEVIKLIERFGEASGSEETWRKVSKELIKETLALGNKVERTEARALYPAAIKDIHLILQNLRGSALSIKFEDGKYAGVNNYHAREGKVKTPHGRDFTFENLRKEAEEAAPLAGREFALWIVKDLRRGGPRQILVDAVQEQSKHPGVSPFAERLEKAGDLDRIEKEIRGEPGNSPGDRKEEEKP